MFKAWRLDASSGVRELTSTAFRLCEVEETYLLAEQPRDNREAWAQTLDPGFHRIHDCVDALRPMLRIYLSARDSTCGVERDLGIVSRILQAHSGPTDEDGNTVSYCTEMLLDLSLIHI